MTQTDSSEKKEELEFESEFGRENDSGEESAETAQGIKEEKAPKIRTRGILRWALLIVAGIAVLFAFGMYRELTSELWSVIGRPARYLSNFQKIYYSIQLDQVKDEIVAANTAMSGREILTVNDNDTPQSVASRAELNGIVRDRDLFLKYLIYRGIDRQLVPSRYVIPEGSSLKDVADALLSPEQRLMQFGVLAGLRLEEIADALPAYGLNVEPAEFLESARNYPREKHPTGGTSLEGFILSGQYLVHQTITAEAFLDGMVQSFNDGVTPEIREGLARQGLTLEQGVILASMVTREAVWTFEMSLIASVYVNRYHAGMKYQCDPTVQYALGYNEASGWWKPDLTVDDLAIASPYNTYVVDGLPPTAISSISIDALSAVANPVPSTFLYFRAACEGGYHQFSETYEEHVAKACGSN